MATEVFHVCFILEECLRILHAQCQVVIFCEVGEETHCRPISCSFCHLAWINQTMDVRWDLIVSCEVSQTIHQLRVGERRAPVTDSVDTTKGHFATDHSSCNVFHVFHSELSLLEFGCSHNLTPLAPAEGRIRYSLYEEHCTHHGCTSHLTPCTSHVTPCTSHVTPCTSHLTPCTSHVTPCTSHVTPCTSHVIPCTSHVTPCTSHVTPCCSATVY